MNFSELFCLILIFDWRSAVHQLLMITRRALASYLHDALLGD
jgi:hypothetical protein